MNVARIRNWLNRLSGWHRIGVIASISWVIYASALALEPLTHDSICPNSRRDFWQCQSVMEWEVIQEFTVSAPGMNQDLTASNPPDFHHQKKMNGIFRWGQYLTFAITPVIFLWSISYFMVWLFKWVLAGFRKGKNG